MPPNQMCYVLLLKKRRQPPKAHSEAATSLFAFNSSPRVSRTCAKTKPPLLRVTAWCSKFDEKVKGIARRSVGFPKIDAARKQS